MKNTYQKTIYACFTGYIVQAVVNNFVPLLFLTFEKAYQIPLGQITMLITFNFGVQLLVDLVSAGLVDKIGYRVSVVFAHVFSAAGLLGLTILPDVMPSAFGGLLIAVTLYAIGGGLIEVLISPIMESCPTLYSGRLRVGEWLHREGIPYYAMNLLIYILPILTSSVQ